MNPKLNPMTPVLKKRAGYATKRETKLMMNIIKKKIGKSATDC